MASDQADAEVQPLVARAQAVLAAVDRGRKFTDGDLVEVTTDDAHRGWGAALRPRWAWRTWTAIAPSPTAVAQRLVEPERTSPAANTPRTSVWRRVAMAAAGPVSVKTLC